MVVKPQSNVVPALALVSVFPLALLIASCGLGVNIDITSRQQMSFTVNSIRDLLARLLMQFTKRRQIIFE